MELVRENQKRTANMHAVKINIIKDAYKTRTKGDYYEKELYQ